MGDHDSAGDVGEGIWAGGRALVVGVRVYGPSAWGGEFEGVGGECESGEAVSEYVSYFISF